MMGLILREKDCVLYLYFMSSLGFRPLMLIVQKVIYIAFNLHDGKLFKTNLLPTNKFEVPCSEQSERSFHVWTSPLKQKMIINNVLWLKLFL